MSRINRIAHSLIQTNNDYSRIGRTVKAMRVHDLGAGKNQYVQFVAFRDNLWVGSWQELDNAAEIIIGTIVSAHPKKEEIEEKISSYSPDDPCSFVRDYIPDAICGYYDRKTKRVGVGHSYSVTSSPLLKKVVEAFGARAAEQTGSDDKTRVYKKNQIKGNWDFSRLFYHGTSSEYFDGIVRLGLKPMPHQTNYSQVVHEDTIFLTPVWEEAAHHAFHTAGRRHFMPMIVSVTISDPALVIPDFDVDQQSTRGWYEHERDSDQFYSVGSEKASKHAGLLGYKGRIPSKFIRALYFYSYYEKNWKRLTPDKFSKAMSGVDNYGEEFWNYRLGYPEQDR